MEADCAGSRTAVMADLLLVVDLARIGVDLDLEALAGAVDTLGLVAAAMSADVADLGVALGFQLCLDRGLGQRRSRSAAGFLRQDRLRQQGEGAGHGGRDGQSTHAQSPRVVDACGDWRGCLTAS